MFRLCLSPSHPFIVFTPCQCECFFGKPPQECEQCECSFGNPCDPSGSLYVCPLGPCRTLLGFHPYVSFAGLWGCLLGPACPSGLWPYCVCSGQLVLLDAAYFLTASQTASGASATGPLSKEEQSMLLCPQRLSPLDGGYPTHAHAHVYIYIYIYIYEYISTYLHNLFFHTTMPIPDACRWIPLEELVCLLEISHR